MAGGTSEARSPPAMASSIAFIKSTCFCVELVVRRVWGCLAYHLGFGEDWADDGCEKEEREEEMKTRKREKHEEEDENKSRKKEVEHKEEDDRTGTRKREEEEGTKTKANGGEEIKFGVMLRRGPKRPGVDPGGGGQVN